MFISSVLELFRADLTMSCIGRNGNGELWLRRTALLSLWTDVKLTRDCWRKYESSTTSCHSTMWVDFVFTPVWFAWC